MTKRTLYATTLLLMLCIAAISFFLLIHQSLRLDEAQTFWEVDRLPIGILHAVGEDVHVPLYLLSIYVWEIFFGNGVAINRVFSLIFYLASVPLLILLGNKIYRSPRISIFAAALFALSPFMNWYGNEVRMYSMLVFFTIINQYFFISLRKENRTGLWVGYGITAILGIYTHYFFGLVLLSQAIFYFVYRNTFPQKVFKKFFITAIAVFVALAPWLVYVQFLGQAGNSVPLLMPPSAIDIFNTFSEFFFGSQSNPINSFFVALWPLIMLAWFFSLQKTHKMTPEGAYLFLSVVIPIGTAFAISVTYRPIYLVRYLLFTLPAICLLVSAMIEVYSARLRQILQIALIVLMAVMLYVEQANVNTPIQENYKQATDYLQAHAVSQDVITLSAPFTIYPVEYYYQGPVSVKTLPLWDQYATGPIPAFNPQTIASQVKEIAGNHARLWLLLSYNQGYESQIQSYFDAHYKKISSQTFSPDLTLSLYELRYDLPLKGNQTML